MKYVKMTAKTEGSFKATYVVSADSLLSKSDVFAYCQQLTLRDMMNAETLDEDDMEYDLEDEPLDEDEFLSYMADYQHVRETLRVCVLGNPNDNILSVYKVYHNDMSEIPQFYTFSAQCSQDQEIDSLGYVDGDHPREEVFEKARQDCLYQLKRYCKVDGLTIYSGLFVMAEVDQEDYEQEVDDRDLVLA